MYKRVFMYKIIYTILLMMIWSACNSRHSNIENAYIPSEPDYTDSKMWYINLNDTDDSGADILSIHPYAVLGLKQLTSKEATVKATPTPTTPAHP